MTEQEAKDVLEAYMKCEKRKNNLVYEEKCNNDCDNCELCYEKGTVGEHKEAVEMAIKALEEIQQYRAIGTVEECKNSVLKILEAYNKAIDDFVKEICKMIVQSENNGNHKFYAVEIKQAIADLAEQLKAGVAND